MTKYFDFNGDYFVRTYPKDTVIEIANSKGKVETMFPKDSLKIDGKLFLLCRDTKGNARVFIEKDAAKDEFIQIDEVVGETAEATETAEAEASEKKPPATEEKAKAAPMLEEVDEVQKQFILSEYEKLIQVEKIEAEVKEADKQSKRYVMIPSGSNNRMYVLLLAVAILFLPEIIFTQWLKLDSTIASYVSFGIAAVFIVAFVVLYFIRKSKALSGEVVPIYIYNARALAKGEKIKNNVLQSTTAVQDDFSEINPAKLHDLNIKREDNAIPFPTFRQPGRKFVLFYYVFVNGTAVKQCTLITNNQIKDYLLKCNRHTATFNAQTQTSTLIILRKKVVVSLDSLRPEETKTEPASIEASADANAISETDNKN